MFDIIIFSYFDYKTAVAPESILQAYTINCHTSFCRTLNFEMVSDISKMDEFVKKSYLNLNSTPHQIYDVFDGSDQSTI